MNPNHRIILACRDQERAELARKKVAALLPEGDDFQENVIALACDHTSMESVRSFNQTLRLSLDETYSPRKWDYNGIDVLCLNAAILASGHLPAQFTKDGVEVTFQTNYLAPFQIVHETLDLLNPGARIVLTTSGLYEFETLSLKGMIDQQTGEARKRFDMPDGSDFHFKRSYALSKLCVVAFCAELKHRLRNNERNITVNCFSPGLMLSSGLFRHQNTLRSNSLSEDILSKEKTVDWGGGSLAYMALATDTAKRSGEYWRDANSVLGWKSVYGKHFTPTDITEQFDREMRQQLYELSCQLIAIPFSEDGLA